MKKLTDKQMLDWIEKERAEIRYTWDLATEPWGVAFGGEPGDERHWVCESVTLRQAIALAMSFD